MEDVVGVCFERVELCRELADVPESDCLIARSCDEEVGRGGCKCYGVYLGRVALDLLAWLRRVLGTRVPDHQLPVIADRGEHVVVLCVPVYVADVAGVTSVLAQWLEAGFVLFVLFDVPGVRWEGEKTYQ